MYDTTFDEILELLHPLVNVQQASKHHPEGDALFHSLQVYEQAKAAGSDPALRAAALLHDVGKGHSSEFHAEVGAELIGESVQRRVS